MWDYCNYDYAFLQIYINNMFSAGVMHNIEMTAYLINFNRIKCVPIPDPVVMLKFSVT